MFSPEFSVAPTPPSDPIPSLRDVSPGNWDILYVVRGGPWGPPGAQSDPWIFSKENPVIQWPSNLGREATPPHANCYSKAVDAVAFDVAFGTNDRFPPFSGLSPSFDNNATSPSLAPAEGRCTCSSPERCLCLVFTDALAMGNIEGVNGDVAAYPSSSTSAATSNTPYPPPHPSYWSQNIEESFKISGSSKIPPMDVPQQWLDGIEPATLSNEISPSDLAAWIDESLDFWEITKMIDFNQHLIVSEESVGVCEWTDEDGAVCRDKLTRASLPGHLSSHGIKSMSRDSPTKCKWFGCTRKKPINRESIVRHIREVHLRLKRPPKRAQEPYTGSLKLEA